MSVIWVIEKSSDNLDSAASALVGDFPVRLFASMDSFQMLLRVNRRNMPDLLIVDNSACSWSLDRLRDSLSYYMPQVPCIYLSQSNTQAAEKVDGIYTYAEAKGNGALSRFASGILASVKGDRSINRGLLRYRDIQLNFAQVECKVVPNGESQALPLKEAQLLKLFLERPGVCMPRDEIQSIVWSELKVSSRTIDSHISRLRKRLSSAEVSIHSVYGGGYILR